MKAILIIGLVLFAYTPCFANEQSHVATIIKLNGTVDIFTNPQSKPVGESPRALYRGTYYTLKRAQIGTKVKNGNIVRTQANAKARIVFDNGDQYNIGPNTSYKVSWRGKKSNLIVNFLYGKLRSIISSKGARKNMKVKTKNMTLGVRGTDFYVSSKGAGKVEKVSVIRGKVALNVPKKTTTKNEKKKFEKVVVDTGFSAEVAKKIEKVEEKEAKKEEPVVQVRKTSKQDLAMVQKTSRIKTSKEQERTLTPEKKKQIEKLEKKAIKNTLDDIKKYDPKLYDKISKEDSTNIAKINTAVIKENFEKAPDVPNKPSFDDLSDIDEDAYDQYFKIE